MENNFNFQEFSTPHYQGAWIPFDGDRFTFRTKIENFLKVKLQDPQGSLRVESDGPHWVGAQTIEISYSHAQGLGVLVFSLFPIGVDLERTDRDLTNSLKIAERYFQVSELLALQSLNPLEQNEKFIELWIKKEALGKLTRLGLVHSIHESTEVPLDCKGEAISGTPEPFRSYCLFKLTQ